MCKYLLSLNLPQDGGALRERGESREEMYSRGGSLN
jgi:hypothetical protein